MSHGSSRRLVGVCVAVTVILLSIAAGTGRGEPFGVWVNGLDRACPGFSTQAWLDDGFGPFDAVATLSIEQRTEYAEVPGALRRWYDENHWAPDGLPDHASITWTLMHGTAVDGADATFRVDARLARLTQNFDSHFVGVGYLKVTRGDQAKVISQDASSFAGSFTRGMSINAGAGVCPGSKRVD